MASRAFESWMERLDAGHLTHSLILQAGRIITAHAEHGSIPGGRHTSLTLDEAKLLRERLAESPVHLTPKHTEQGIDWFIRRASVELGIDDEFARELYRSFDHFTWDGTIEIDGNWPYVSVVPVWTMHMRDGRRYQYYFASGWRDRRGNVGHLWPVREESTS